VATDKYPGGIDWFEGVVFTHKVGVQRKHVHTWALTAIRAIVDGRKTRNLKNAGLMMVAENEELLLPEFMHTRSVVTDRQKWPKPLISFERLVQDPSL
jgi:hypothetical protein